MEVSTLYIWLLEYSFLRVYYVISIFKGKIFKLLKILSKYLFLKKNKKTSCHLLSTRSYHKEKENVTKTTVFHVDDTGSLWLTKRIFSCVWWVSGKRFALSFAVDSHDTYIIVFVSAEKHDIRTGCEAYGRHMTRVSAPSVWAYLTCFQCIMRNGTSAIVFGYFPLHFYASRRCFQNFQRSLWRWRFVYQQNNSFKLYE